MEQVFPSKGRYIHNHLFYKIYIFKVFFIMNTAGNISETVAMATSWGCAGLVSSDFFTAIKENLPSDEREVNLCYHLPFLKLLSRFFCFISKLNE